MGKHDTPKKCQKKNIAKRFEFKFEFYLEFTENVFLVSVLPLEKCSRCRISSSEFIDIYIYVLYKNTISFSIIGFLSLW